MSPVLTDEQTEALVQLLLRTIQDDRHPLSPRIVTLKEILGVLRPEPEREPLPRGGAANRGLQGRLRTPCVAMALPICGPGRSSFCINPV